MRCTDPNGHSLCIVFQCSVSYNLQMFPSISIKTLMPCHLSEYNLNIQPVGKADEFKFK